MVIATQPLRSLLLVPNPEPDESSPHLTVLILEDLLQYFITVEITVGDNSNKSKFDSRGN
jgi:hypothetical protein